MSKQDQKQNDKEKKEFLGTCVFNFLNNIDIIKQSNTYGEKKLKQLYENIDSFIGYIANKRFKINYISLSLSQQLNKNIDEEKKQKDYDQIDQIKESVQYLYKAIVLEPEDLQKELKIIENESSNSEYEDEDDSFIDRISIQKTMIRISSKIREIKENQSNPERRIHSYIEIETRGLIRICNPDKKKKNIIKKINQIKSVIKTLIVSGDIEKKDSIFFEASEYHKKRNRLRIAILKYFQKRYPNILKIENIVDELSNDDESLMADLKDKTLLKDSLKDLLNYDLIKEEKNIFIIAKECENNISKEIIYEIKEKNNIENQIKTEIIKYVDKIYPHTLIKKDFYLELPSFITKKITESEYLKLFKNIIKELIKSKFIVEGNKQKDIYSLNEKYKDGFSKDIFWNNLLNKEQQKTNKGITNIIIEFLMKDVSGSLTEKIIASELSKILYPYFAGKDDSFEEKADFLKEKEEEKADKNFEDSVASNSSSMKISEQDFIEKEAEYCLEEYIDEVKLNVVNSFKKEKPETFYKCKEVQAHIALMVKLYLNWLKVKNEETENLFESISSHKFANTNDETECIKEILNGKKFQSFIELEIGKKDTLSDGTVSSILNMYSLASLESVKDSCAHGYHCEEGGKIINKFYRKLVAFLNGMYLEVIGEKK